VLVSSIAVGAVALGLPYLPGLASAFGFVPLPVSLLAVLLAITLAYLVANEVAKRTFQRRIGL